MALLKLSLGASIATLPRVVTESEVARAAVISSLFDAIPLSHRAELGLDWFPEPGGIVETDGGTGWLLRQFPRTFAARRDRRLVPAFSLISRHQGELPLLVKMAGRSRRRPETFIVDEILRPYVRAMAYLFFEHGLQPEGHTQNVLVEVNGDRELTGRLVLRDFSDTTVNIAYRMARRLPFPLLGERPMRSPWPLSVNAADFADVRSRRVRRGRAVIEGYGQHGFVWPINHVMSRYARRYDSARVTREYLELWQHAARFYTNVTPVLRTRPSGLAADEAVAYYLRETDWDALGAAPAVLPRQAQPLLIDGRACRRAGRVYERVEGAWGDLYLNRGLPEFFHAAY
jgi:hypothetical protein